ncbi:MAG TPA: histidine phosphatase family protein [Egibacteraceae bacterium]|nr:histidine phosphatase family protein [Egibacteraceae bacterium]
MTTLVLVRHATTASTGKRLGGRTDAPLDDAGRQQAAAAAERLSGLPVKAVYASPLPRTAETAAIVAGPHGVDVTPWQGLLEVEYGDWTDRPLAPLTRTKRWPVIQQRPSLVRFPNGETIRQAQLRAVEAIEAIVARHRRDTVVAVSHADVIKAVVAFYLGQPLDLFQRLHVSPASATVLHLSPDGDMPMLSRFNDDGPLRPPPAPATTRRRRG